MEEAAFVAQSVFPIFLQEQGTVEIDEAGLLRQQYRRCHSQRGGDHAADHQVQSARARLGCQAQALAEAAGLVELEVDAFIAGGQFREIGGQCGRIRRRRRGPGVQTRRAGRLGRRAEAVR